MFISWNSGVWVSENNVTCAAFAVQEKCAALKLMTLGRVVNRLCSPYHKSSNNKEFMRTGLLQEKVFLSRFSEGSSFGWTA